MPAGIVSNVIIFSVAERADKSTLVTGLAISTQRSAHGTPGSSTLSPQSFQAKGLKTRGRSKEVGLLNNVQQRATLSKLLGKCQRTLLTSSARLNCKRSPTPFKMRSKKSILALIS